MIDLLVMALKINVSHSTEGLSALVAKVKRLGIVKVVNLQPVIRFFSHLFRPPDRGIYKKIKEIATVVNEDESRRLIRLLAAD